VFHFYLKQAMRVLQRKRIFSVAVIATFAVAIGVNATTFSLRDAILERTIEVANAENLVAIYGASRGEAANGSFSRGDYLYYKEHLKGVSDLAAHYSTSPMTFSAAGMFPQPIVGSAVSGNFFPMLGLRPEAGRFFSPEEDAVDGRDAVVVLSHGFWKREFSADTDIVGKQIKLNGTDFTVVGVAPATFHGIVATGSPNDVWVPLSMSSVAYRPCDTKRPECRFLDLVGRLAEGSSVERLQAEADVLARQLKTQRGGQAQPASAANWKDVIVMPQRGVGALHRTQLTQLLNLLRSAALILLLIACVNVSGLFLVQMESRTKEMAVRLALGSTQRQLYFQMLTETGLLSLLGGAGGLLMAYWLSGPLSKFPLIDAPNFTSEIRINAPLIIFTVGLVMLCAIIATVIPAIRLLRSNLFGWLKDQHSAGGNKNSRAHDALIVTQVALSLALVAGSGLLVVSLRTILSGPGFDPGRLAFFRVTPRLSGYSPEKSAALQREIAARLLALPGVESVSLGQFLPWWPTRRQIVWLPGQAPERDEDKLEVEHDLIAPEYLSTLQIPLVAGREFDEGDRKQTPKVAIVNESLASILFPGSDAVGNSIVIGNVEHSVVGVAKDAKYHLASVKSAPYFYVPYWQNNDGLDARFCVRTAGDPRAMTQAIRGEVQKIDPEAPMTAIVTMEQGLKAWFSSVYLANRVLISASAIACFLSMLGLYSLIAFSIVKRNREIGIRIALGATRSNILRLMIRRGVVLTALGAVLGIGLALLSLRILDSLLYGVRPADPVVLLAAAIVLILVSLAASFLPAQRATRIDPIRAIREG
jgi:putative ABC transport system permease protein